GRIADIHHLLPESGLYIIGEHFFRVRHQLMAPRGATLEGLKTVYSQLPALGQCRKLIAELGLTPISAGDTAGSARYVAERNDPTEAALATSLAAEIYGLDVLRADVEDAGHNTTRFVIMSPTPQDAEPGPAPVMTSFVFQVRNVPAALYKALGGFATNGINMTKLESYQLDGSFNATQFYADVEGHPSERLVRLALEELEFFSAHLKILGVYPAHPYRLLQSRNQTTK
ncbi:MAG TPA: prephenate dehydratase, partial [Alphaproteobacteria bacterium]|nr:prephenate dehydratase [Alphaproteobacteria bacterium]